MQTNGQVTLPLRERWQWRYGFLALLLALLVWNLEALPEFLHSGIPAPFGNLFMAVGLVFGHLVASFIPRGRWANLLWGFFYLWLAFVVAYLHMSSSCNASG